MRIQAGINVLTPRADYQFMYWYRHQYHRYQRARHNRIRRAFIYKWFLSQINEGPLMVNRVTQEKFRYYPGFVRVKRSVWLKYISKKNAI
jgi:hypothetical protein